MPAVSRGRVAALVTAWIAVMTRPGSFFRERITPGRQAPGLVFAMAVVGVEELVRVTLVGADISAIGGGPVVDAAVVIGVAVLLVTPAALHLVAGLQTLLVVPLTKDRGGISETVQVLAYATAPCVAAGWPSPGTRIVCGAYGAWLLWIGLRVRHGLGPRRAGVAAAIPAAVVFGYGFRAFPAIGTLLAQWYII